MAGQAEVIDKDCIAVPQDKIHAETECTSLDDRKVTKIRQFFQEIFASLDILYKILKCLNSKLRPRGSGFELLVLVTFFYTVIMRFNVFVMRDLDVIYTTIPIWGIQLLQRQMMLF